MLVWAAVGVGGSEVKENLCGWFVWLAGRVTGGLGACICRCVQVSGGAAAGEAHRDLGGPVHHSRRRMEVPGLNVDISTCQRSLKSLIKNLFEMHNPVTEGGNT